MGAKEKSFLLEILVKDSHIVHWSIGLLVHWSIGPLDHRTIGPLVYWSIGPLVFWSIGSLDHLSIGPLGHWSIGPLIECQMSKVNKGKLLSECTSGVPPVIFLFKGLRSLAVDFN